RPAPPCRRSGDRASAASRRPARRLRGSTGPPRRRSRGSLPRRRGWRAAWLPRRSHGDGARRPGRAWAVVYRRYIITSIGVRNPRNSRAYSYIAATGSPSRRRLEAADDVAQAAREVERRTVLEVGADDLHADGEPRGRAADGRDRRRKEDHADDARPGHLIGVQARLPVHLNRAREHVAFVVV